MPVSHTCITHAHTHIWMQRYSVEIIIDHIAPGMVIKMIASQISSSVDWFWEWRILPAFRLQVVNETCFVEKKKKKTPHHLVTGARAFLCWKKISYFSRGNLTFFALVHSWKLKSWNRFAQMPNSIRRNGKNSLAYSEYGIVHRIRWINAKRKSNDFGALSRESKPTQKWQANPLLKL